MLYGVSDSVSLENDVDFDYFEVVALVEHWLELLFYDFVELFLVEDFLGLRD